MNKHSTEANVCVQRGTVQSHRNVAIIWLDRRYHRNSALEFLLIQQGDEWVAIPDRATSDLWISGHRDDGIRMPRCEVEMSWRGCEDADCRSTAAIAFIICLFIVLDLLFNS
jgi:hypothetical protein